MLSFILFASMNAGAAPNINLGVSYTQSDADGVSIFIKSTDDAGVLIAEYVAHSWNNDTVVDRVTLKNYSAGTSTELNVYNGDEDQIHFAQTTTTAKNEIGVIGKSLNYSKCESEKLSNLVKLGNLLLVAYISQNSISNADITADMQSLLVDPFFTMNVASYRALCPNACD